MPRDRKRTNSNNSQWGDFIKAVLNLPHVFCLAELADESCVPLNTCYRKILPLVDVGLLSMERVVAANGARVKYQFTKRGELAALQSQNSKE